MDEQLEVVDRACFDPQRLWESIRDLWDQLELDDRLARDWPREKRWLLDRLFDRMRALDRLFEEHEAAAVWAELEEVLGEGGDSDSN
jgi:hypothetical protein